VSRRRLSCWIVASITQGNGFTRSTDPLGNLSPLKGDKNPEFRSTPRRIATLRDDDEGQNRPRVAAGRV